MGRYSSRLSITFAVTLVAVFAGLGVFGGAGLACGASEPAAESPAGWPLLEGAETLIGFGDTYTAASGTSSVHRGIDLAAEPGDAILAPVAGEVLFCGAVPSEGGGTHLAVTIDAGAAGVVSLTPLERAYVSEGDLADAGSRIGSLAETGDASGGSTHLHVSLRVEGEYVDPMGLLILPKSAPRLLPEPASHSAPSAASGAGPVSPQPESCPEPASASSRPQHSPPLATQPEVPVKVASRPAHSVGVRDSLASMPVILAEAAHRAVRVSSSLDAARQSVDRPISRRARRQTGVWMDTSEAAQPLVLASPLLFLALAAWLKRRSSSLQAVSRRGE